MKKLIFLTLLLFSCSSYCDYTISYFNTDSLSQLQESLPEKNQIWISAHYVNQSEWTEHPFFNLEKEQSPAQVYLAGQTAFRIDKPIEFFKESFFNNLPNLYKLNPQKKFSQISTEPFVFLTQVPSPFFSIEFKTDSQFWQYQNTLPEYNKDTQDLLKMSSFKKTPQALTYQYMFDFNHIFHSTRVFSEYVKISSTETLIIITTVSTIQKGSFSFPIVGKKIKSYVLNKYIDEVLQGANALQNFKD